MDISSLNQSIVKQSYQARSSATVTSSIIAPVASNNEQSNRQDALRLVDRLLQDAYAKISGQVTGNSNAIASYGAVEPLTAEKVASNILGFIERRLMMDVADGASEEQLQSRLDAGLTGFKKGFAEAEAQLSALSMLSPAVSTDIQDTFDRVLKGIDDLRLRYINQMLDKDDKDTK